MVAESFSSTKKTIIGLIAITAGLVGLSGSLILTLHKTVYQGKASVESTPAEIRLTNLSGNSLSISWLTQELVIGGVIYGTNPSLSPSLTGFDDREGEVRSTVHHVTLKNLKPETTYYFRLISGDSYFDNQGSPYTFSTPRHSGQTPAPPYIFKGKLGRQEVLIYFSFNDSTPISTLTDEQGNFLLSFNNALRKDKSNYYPVQKGEKGLLLIQDKETAQTFEVVIGEEVFSPETATSADGEREVSLEANLPLPEEHLFLSIKMRLALFLRSLIERLTGNI